MQGLFEKPIRSVSARQVRMRRCLLKGCELRFRPSQPRQRYCSEHCREAARKWSRCKAQERYRETTAGKEKRNGQSRRYRKRARNRKPPEPEAFDEAARVITKEEFFRSFLRSAGVLREIRAPASKSFETLLLPSLPARHGACLGAGAALAASARLNPDILIPAHPGLTFSF